MPAVSVIIPVYNDADGLRRALASVREQSMGDFEIIVIDDGSTDDLNAVLVAAQDDRLRLLQHDTNRGAAAARNTGIRAASGEFIAFLDSDDEWLSEKLALQLAYMCSSADRLCSYTGYYRHRYWDQQSVTHFGHSSGNWYRRMHWGCDLSPGSTLMVRRAAFDEVGQFDEELKRLEDWDWLLRFTARHDVGAVEKPLAIVHSRRPPESAPVVEAIAQICEKHLPRLQPGEFNLRRQFRSSVTAELASAHYHRGQKLKATWLVARSMSIYPFRNWKFIANLPRQALRPKIPKPRRVAERPKVMHVITGLGIGGAENMLANVVEDSVRRNESPVVVSIVSGGPIADRLKASGARVFDLEMRPQRASIRGLFRMVRLIRRERPDIIQSWMYHADLLSTFGLWLSGRRPRVRFFWGVRCSAMDFAAYGPLLRFTVRACAILSGRPDAVTFNSYSGLEAHLRLGYRPKRFAVIDNGVDIGRFRPDTDARNELRRELEIPDDAVAVVMVARVDPMKGHADFLDAFERLDGVHGILLGSGTEFLPEKPRLHRLGARHRVQRYLAASDIVVSSSIFGEGFSNAVAEGMAAGLPAVTTDVGDARRIVGNTGIVVAPHDPGALASAIRTLAADGELRRHAGALARSRIVQHFTLERTIGAFRALHGGAIPDAFEPAATIAEKAMPEVP